MLDVFHHVDQHLGRAQIGSGRFVDHLRDDRLALGDLAAPSVDRHDDRLVQRGDTIRNSVYVPFAGSIARFGVRNYHEPHHRLGRGAAA
jgi:hypothetical protein